MNLSRPDPGLSNDLTQPQPRREAHTERADIDLRGILRVLWRRKTIIAGTVAVLTVIAAIILTQITPRYSSRAQVLLDSRGGQIVGNTDSPGFGSAGDSEAIRSEIEIIRSQNLAEKVIRDLELYDNPEFNKELRSEGVLDSMISGVTGLMRYFVAEGDEEQTPIELQFNRERVAIIDSFDSRLTVERRGESRVVAIEFESKDPETSVLVANAMAEAYLIEQLEARFEATQRATSWLGDRLDELRKQVEQSESAVEAYRRQAGLIKGQNATLTEQQISELNSQLIIAQSARAEAEARLRQVTSLLGSNDKVDSVAEVLASPLIQSLRREEASIEQRIAELSNEYGDKHPRMVSARAERADLKDRISAEVSKIVQNLRNEMSVARAREASLRSSLRGLEQRMADMNDSGIDLRALQREAEANRQLYESFLARFKETSSQEDSPNKESRIISYAELPTVPSYPKKRLTILLVVVGALVLGIVLAFAQEQLTPGFVSLEQIETVLGMPALGLIPSIPRGKGKPEDYAIKNPLSELHEAARTIYTALSLSYVGQRPKLILVTSAFPKEGKTTASLLLARVSAMLGKKAIIIDADLRRAEVHSRLGLKASPGLVELLSGEAQLEEVLQEDKATGLKVLPVGRISSHAAELHDSDKFEKLLNRITREYELVIIDSPPTMAVADARILSRLADVTIFVARWSTTRREAVALAIRQIIEAGGNIGGIVLSRVNTGKHATYGYGDAGAYYGELKKYYSN